MEETEGTITVRGEAVVATDPDEVRFRLSLSAVRSRHAEALQDVTPAAMNSMRSSMSSASRRPSAPRPGSRSARTANGSRNAPSTVATKRAPRSSSVSTIHRSPASSWKEPSSVQRHSSTGRGGPWTEITRLGSRPAGRRRATLGGKRRRTRTHRASRWVRSCRSGRPSRHRGPAAGCCRAGHEQ